MLSPPFYLEGFGVAWSLWSPDDVEICQCTTAHCVLVKTKPYSYAILKPFRLPLITPIQRNVSRTKYWAFEVT